jgi:aspartyl-tRNA(Asn)/glutamyl-tRNA(Gln) amidotransferase subunit A
VQMYLGDIFTIPAPLAGLPALSIPCGYDPAGLPVGLQLMGPHVAEGLLLGTAHRYQQATDWHTRVPTETPL